MEDKILAFNVKEQTENCIEWIRNYMVGKPKNIIIGISGGKDSSVVAALCVKAIGADRVIGVMMPNGEQKDISDSKRICEHLKIKNYTVNIEDAYMGLTNRIRVCALNGEEYPNYQYKTNTPARLRMVTLFGVAAFHDGIVVNTCNLSEDMQGFSSFGGDSFGCFAPIAKLTTEEVVAIGDYLELPKDLVHKAPSDGMCGKTDEDSLGYTYHEINEVIRNDVRGEHYEAIMERYRKNKFKLDIIQMPAYDPALPNFIVLNA